LVTYILSVVSRIDIVTLVNCN